MICVVNLQPLQSMFATIVLYVYFESYDENKQSMPYLYVLQIMKNAQC